MLLINLFLGINVVSNFSCSFFEKLNIICSYKKTKPIGKNKFALTTTPNFYFFSPDLTTYISWCVPFRITLLCIYMYVYVCVHTCMCMHTYW